MSSIRIWGARENNLKNINVMIPKHRLTAVSGVSGSGKSTLIYDILFNEAQRQYLDSLSSYARRILPRYETTDFDRIEGLTSCISINQGMFTGNPKSTVGTYTELYTHLRLLFSRMGDSMLSAGDFSFNTPAGACPTCGGLGTAMTVNKNKLLDMGKSLNEGAIQHKTWKVGSRYWNIIRASEFYDMDKKLCDFTEEEMNRLLYSEAVSIQSKGAKVAQSFSYEGIVKRLIKRKKDERGLSTADYDSQFFSDGVCPECGGVRLSEKARNVKLGKRFTMRDFVECELSEIPGLLAQLDSSSPEAKMLFPIIIKQVESIQGLGIGYLNLNRSISSVSGGEAQKLKLAKQLVSSLTDITYILDEPTAGLHERDVRKLSDSLKKIVKRGNTVIVIEHEPYILREADYILDIGPGAGVKGGQLIASGTPQEIRKNEKSSLFTVFNRADSNTIKGHFKEQNVKFRSYKDIHINNIDGESVKIPENSITVLTGVSGSGKTSLSRYITANTPKAVVMDQSQIGSTSRGNIATYSEVFDSIRELYAWCTGQSPSLFSFNSEGSCPECNGKGYIETDMHYLGNVRNVCDACGGKRYKDKVLKFTYHGKNISEVLEMTVSEALEFFEGKEEIVKGLKTLERIGLEYITLGQPLNTLSGGEGQRLKLSQKLSQRGNVYIFDEPTRGLHPKDTEKIINVLRFLVKSKNTVIVIEHNLDVIAQADWIIDMGPDGGKNGGKVIFQGTVDDIVYCPDSLTGRFLRERM
ncbi:MAG: excinuclease ABC subunit UvrA [Lachnospiraceae bacterium]|nr:excinuclease ABC subunit UvrA [Lachnospiraceae bacterium]